MIELLILIAGIVILWKFSGLLNVTAIASEQAARVWGEDIIKDSVVERQYLVADFEKELAKLKAKNPDFELQSSEDFLKSMKVHK